MFSYIFKKWTFTYLYKHNIGLSHLTLYLVRGTLRALIVQENEFENLVSFNTKSNQGLTSWDDVMDILEQHQVVCTMGLWYQKIFMGNFKGGVCIDGRLLPQKWEYVYIIVNIFVNKQSNLKILASKRNGFKGLYLCKNKLQ